MKRCLSALLFLLLLCGCARTDNEIDRVMQLRERMLSAERVEFKAGITADYGDRVFRCSMLCSMDSDEVLKFEIIEPEEISGISGSISSAGGKITFDDIALAFDLLADGQVSPVSAPWLLLHTLRGGYIISGAREGELLRVGINDSYGEKSLRLDVWLDTQNIPVNAEVLWNGKRFLAITVEDFTIM